jgi:hypothetical protein
MYVLKHTETGKYVAPPGRDKSYTDRLEEARVFTTQRQAEKNRCVESEVVVAIAALLTAPGRDGS